MMADGGTVGATNGAAPGLSPVELLISSVGAAPEHARSSAACAGAPMLAALDVGTRADAVKRLVKLGADRQAIGRAVKAALDAAAKRREPEAEDPRPEIRITAEMHLMVADGVAALTEDDGLYQRDGKLVHVVQMDADDCGDPDAGQQRYAPGTPVIREALNLTERLTRHSRWLGFDGRREEWCPKLPPERVVREIQKRGVWRGISDLVGVIEAPSMEPSGDLIIAPGWNRATRFEYRPNADYRVDLIPYAPSREECAARLAELIEVFADFPYVTEAHRLVPVCAIMTILARPAIVGAVPGFLFDGSTPGAGKSKQTDAVSIIARGRYAARMFYPVLEEELQKLMAGYALEGAQFVSWDNVEVPFDSPTLNAYFTAQDTIKVRLLGTPLTPEVAWRGVILANGCNLRVWGHCTRRVLVCRIEPRDENPEDRVDFAHPDLEAYCMRERARLVRAALTILRGYVCAGRPEPLRWGGFENWAALIPSAIVWAGGANPMLARPATRGAESDPEKLAIALLLQEWGRLDKRDGLTAKEIIRILFTPERVRGYGSDGSALAPQPELDAMRDAIETLVPTKAGMVPSTKSLGDKLARWKGRPNGGLTFGTSGTSGGAARWKVFQVEGYGVGCAPVEDEERAAIAGEPSPG
jgi:hypothetical protein